jgi:uncharacterized membrane protein
MSPLLSIAIIAAATASVIGLVMILLALLATSAWGWQASLEDRSDGRRSRTKLLLVYGTWLLCIGLLLLAILPAMQPGRSIH